jgi:hypothetical protein
MVYLSRRNIMQIDYKNLDKNGKVIETLSGIKIQNFGTKLKVVRLKKWFDSEVELIQTLIEDINKEFDIKGRFRFDGGVFTGDNREELLEVIKNKKEREEELLGTEIEIPDYGFKEDEIKDLDLTPDDILKLVDLKLFELD